MFSGSEVGRKLAKGWSLSRQANKCRVCENVVCGSYEELQAHYKKRHPNVDFSGDKKK